MAYSNWFKWTTVLTLLTSVQTIHALPLKASQSGTMTAFKLSQQSGLQSWSTLLLQGNQLGLVLDITNDIPLRSLIPQLSGAQGVVPLFTEIVKPVRLSQSQDFMSLATYVLQFREIVRLSDSLDNAEKRSILYLLQMMAEETLYIGSQKFSNFPKELSLSSNAPITLSRDAMIKEFRIQTGDILLSKATGSGSSSLIALSMNNPHIFSHSTPVYIDDQNRALSPEAFIEDGVKLRSLDKDYSSNAKTRLYIYRLKQSYSHKLGAVEKSISNFVRTMEIRTGNKASEVPAYSYDFTMSPGDIEAIGLFCSSVSHRVYEDAGVADDLNPYGTKYWSSISGSRSHLLQILGVNNTSVPAPGDIEANVNYDLVGVRINIERLAQERVEMALFEVLFDEVLREGQTLEKIASKLQSLDEKALDRKFIENLISRKLVPASMIHQLRYLDKIPNNIKLSQLLLFGFMNEVMTPKVRSMMENIIASQKDQNHIVTHQELRETLRSNIDVTKSSLSDVIQKLDQI